jgi:hypothetical protein
MKSDPAFESSVLAAEMAGTMPAWYSSLLSSVLHYYVTWAEAQTTAFEYINKTPIVAVATSTQVLLESRLSRLLLLPLQPARSLFPPRFLLRNSLAISTFTNTAPIATGGIVFRLAGAAGAAGVLDLAFAL